MKSFKQFSKELKEGTIVKKGGLYMAPDFAKKIGAKDGEYIKTSKDTKPVKTQKMKEANELSELTATIKIGSKKETKKFKSEDELVSYIEKNKGEVLDVKE